MKTALLLSTTILFTMTGTAQSISKKQQDKQAIKAITGCYQVTFDYVETFASDTAYHLREPFHAAAPAEWIFVDEETNDKIVLQHLLVINDSTIVKHWRQDWVYENQDLYQFHKGMNWNYEKLSANEAHGQWSQKVYQVDDGPRYEGSATWVHVDGKHYWEDETDSPLPRREIKRRDDYDVMHRTNRHEITNYGWLHEQDNQKVIRKNGQDSVLVAEKGMNRYTKIDEGQCKAGKEWWNTNKAYWRLVRKEWSAVFNRKKDISMADKIDGKKLWQALFALGKRLNKRAEERPKAVRKQIASTINTYLGAQIKTGENTY